MTGLPHESSSAPTVVPVKPQFTEENIVKLRRQIQASHVTAAQNASPLPANTLNAGVPMPKLGPYPLGSGFETLAQLLKLSKESSQPLLDAKVAETYRRSVPASIPLGIDLEKIILERERLVQGKIDARIKKIQEILDEDVQKEADNLTTAERTRLLIEMKSLRLVPVQRQLRETVLRVAHQLRSVDSYVDRSGMRRGKRQSLREARMTERNEQAQRRERNRKERQSYYDYLNSIIAHYRDLQAKWRLMAQRKARLVKQVMQHHANFEREEQKRQERIQKDRLRALKMDDEEAYLKLLDQEKDTRLTYLLKQTDEFLAGLAAKVAAQQEDTQRKMNLDTRLMSSSEDLRSTMVNEGEDEAVIISGDYWGTAHRKKELIEEQPKMLVGGKLKEYQMKGLQWMVSLYNNHLNGILADEMGLGKTIQAISLISYLIDKKGQHGPYLIIVPLSTMTNWSLEMEKWAPGIVKVEYKGVPTQRKVLQNQLKNGRFNVLLTTYEYIIKDRHFLSKIRWLYLIVDEGHRMKNSHSKLTSVLTLHYQTRFRLILTGTPLQNSLPELWALLNFLLPHVFNSCKSFEEWFNTPFANTGERMELNEEEILLIIRRLHKVLRPFLLRRLKKDVEAELPDKVELILKCPMSALQQTLYNTVARRSASALRDPRNVGIRRLNNTIMQLRKICNHPFVFDEVEHQMNPGHLNNELLYRVAGKFELLQRILPKFHSTGHKVLMFFQMTQIMTIMEDMLAMQGYRYLRLDGSTKAEDRSELLRQFNAPDSPYFVFLLSTRAGGLGLNLQSADTVIIFDSDWNPHQDLQAQDRAHRIGQTKEVRIFRLITIDSVEEYILERAQHKLNLDGKIIQAGKFDQKSTNEERDEMLKAILEREAEKNDVDEIYGDDELNEIIARNEIELESFRRLDEEREKVEQQRFEKYGIKQSRLIGPDELPKIYLNDTEPSSAANADESASQDGGEYNLPEMRQARRREVTYDEGMSDSKWLAQLERGDTPSSSSGTNGTRNRKRKKHSQQEAEESDAESILSSSPIKSAPTPRIRLRMKIPKKETVVMAGGAKPDGLSEEARRNIMQSIFDAVENCTEEETNRYRSDLFLELPDRATYPDYYAQIKEPISLAQIESRMSEYNSVHEMISDIELMCLNATKYNMEGSQVYEDAQVMLQVAKDLLEELLHAEGCYEEEVADENGEEEQSEVVEQDVDEEYQSNFEDDN